MPRDGLASRLCYYQHASPSVRVSENLGVRAGLPRSPPKMVSACDLGRREYNQRFQKESRSPPIFQSSQALRPTSLPNAIFPPHEMISPSLPSLRTSPNFRPLTRLRSHPSEVVQMTRGSSSTVLPSHAPSTEDHICRHCTGQGHVLPRGRVRLKRLDHWGKGLHAKAGGLTAHCLALRSNLGLVFIRSLGKRVALCLPESPCPWFVPVNRANHALPCFDFLVFPQP